jgi:hypothetical protein
MFPRADDHGMVFAEVVAAPAPEDRHRDYRKVIHNLGLFVPRHVYPPELRSG